MAQQPNKKKSSASPNKLDVCVSVLYTPILFRFCLQANWSKIFKQKPPNKPEPEPTICGLCKTFVVEKGFDKCQNCLWSFDPFWYTKKK